MSFPIHRALYRTLDPDWEGEVFVADIDRTYLATRFSSMRSLARIPFERAADKEDIAGMARLFREIRRGPQTERRDTPLYFVSASPSQLRPVIERKMMLDGIGFDGTTFKSWSGVVRSLHFGRLREQIGFKVTALLAGRAELPRGAIENLIGDDLETDPVAFALYADIVEGRIPVGDICGILERNGVMPIDAEAVAVARRRLPPTGGVRRALIRMERFAEPEVFQEYGPGIIGCRGAFQMAAVLMHVGNVSFDGVVRVAEELLSRGLTVDDVRGQLLDLHRRALLSEDETMRLAKRLTKVVSMPAVDDLDDPDESWVEVAERSTDQRWTPSRFIEVASTP